MTAWVGDDQLTYLATWDSTGWMLTRRVAGAGVITLGAALPTLHAVEALAEAGLREGFL